MELLGALACAKVTPTERKMFPHCRRQLINWSFLTGDAEGVGDLDASDAPLFHQLLKIQIFLHLQFYPCSKLVYMV